MSRPVSEYVQREPFIPGAVDAHGNPAKSWGAAVTVGIYGFDPGSTSEPREGMSRVFVEPTLYMPTDVTFNSQDRVTARGHLYEVEGETREWRQGEHRPGNVVTLRRVEG